MKRRKQRGNSTVEMALISIPLIFMIVGTVEVSSALWTYHTLAAAVKQGARFAAVHGAGCVAASASCAIGAAAIQQVVRQAGVGLNPALLSLTLSTVGSAESCSAAATCGDGATPWPAAPYNAIGLPLTVSGKYSFQWVGASLWPGQVTTSPTLSATSTEMIQF